MYTNAELTLHSTWLWLHKSTCREWFLHTHWATPWQETSGALSSAQTDTSASEVVAADIRGPCDFHLLAQFQRRLPGVHFHTVPWPVFRGQWETKEAFWHMFESRTFKLAGPTLTNGASCPWSYRAATVRSSSHTSAWRRWESQTSWLLSSELRALGMASGCRSNLSSNPSAGHNPLRTVVMGWQIMLVGGRPINRRLVQLTSEFGYRTFCLDHLAGCPNNPRANNTVLEQLHYVEWQCTLQRYDVDFFFWGGDLKITTESLKARTWVIPNPIEGWVKCNTSNYRRYSLLSWVLTPF